MKALIFNSGLGNRMGEFTRANHKSMARLANGETIFARQLRILADHGVTEFVITTGPFVEQLLEQTQTPRFAGLDFTFVPNAVFDRTNYIYSLHLARAHLDDDVLMLHGDLVFNSRVIERFLADARTDLGMVNAALPQPEKDFKARVQKGAICEVSVTLTEADCHAFQPLYKLSRRAMRLWLERVEEFIDEGNTKVYAENALNDITDEIHIEAFSYEGDSVNEIDTLEDLARVSKEIRLFDFAEQPVLSAVDDYLRIPGLLEGVAAKKPLVVGGNSYEASFLKPFLADHLVEVVRFSEYSSNPKLEEVQAGLQLLQEEQCDAIISVGGGSAIDVAKCIKILAATGTTELPTSGDRIDAEVPHLAIPTTAGTGSESTHFAVVYVNGEKQSVAHDAMLPEWALLEPLLLESLPDYHKKATLLDALSQCVESCWAVGATEPSRDYAMRGIELILGNLFPYFFKGPFDLEASRRMLHAANFGGKAINLTKTTAPHAMSYKLTSLYGIAHGHAVALCLVGVWWLYARLVDEDSPLAVPLREPLDVLTRAFDVDERLQAVHKLRVILEFLQLAAPPLRDAADLDALAASVNQERLSNSPVSLSVVEIRSVYEFVFGLRPLPYVDAGAEALAATNPAPPDATLYANLKALHKYEMAILADFNRFCADHELRYYLSEGSMLGAIRHGGMIPWDDDIDVMMPRTDYRRMVALALHGRLPEGLNLDSFETNTRHWVFGAKLQMTRPTEFYLPKVAHLAQFDGPYIDIFPVDPVAKPSGMKFRVQALLLRTLRRALFMSAGRSRGLRRNPVVRVPLYLLTRVIPTPTIQRWVVWAQSQFNAAPDSEQWANLCTYYPVARELFPRQWFGDGRRISFEGQLIVIPSRAEDMLKQIYGPNFMAIPSLSVRNMRSHVFRSRPFSGAQNEPTMPMNGGCHESAHC